MAEKSDWQFPVEMRPRPEDWRFDLDGALDAVVQLRAEIPDDAFTAQILGTERVGNGVVIREDGLVLTIGYLITEASTIWLTSNKGVVVPAFPLAYDQTTGFGLVQPLGKIGVRPLPRGTAASCRIGENVVVAGHGGRPKALRATVFAKREFAGYWEYVLDEAIYTAPAHPQWGGAALIGSPAMNIVEGIYKNNAVEALGARWPVMKTTASDGQRVKYGIRPEHIDFGNSDIPAEVVVVEPMGAETELLVKVQDHSFTVTTHGRSRAGPGERVFLAPQAAQAHLFDAATGKRL